MQNQANHERGTLSVISDALPNLTGTTQKVARFILNSPQETIDLTITELSSRIGVSDASIVRFAQSLGYPGFHALRLRLAEDIVSPMAIIHEDLTPDDKPATAVQKAMTVGLRSLEDTIRILDVSVLEAAIEAICNARQIVLFASGNSIPIAMDLHFRLTKIGLQSLFAVDPTMQEMQAALTTAEDTAIGISHTGSSKDTVHALTLAKQHRARTICLTNHTNSPLAQQSSICLFTASRISHFRQERLESNLAMLALSEALFVGICIQHSDATVQAFLRTDRATEHRKY